MSTDPLNSPPPDAVQDLLNAAIEHHQAGDAAAAEAIYERVLIVQPDNAAALNLLGLLLAQSGRFDAGIQRLRQACAAAPEDSEYLANLAELHRMHGQIPEAIGVMRRLAALNPRLGAVHKKLAELLYQVGEAAEALAAYRLAVSLDAGDAQAWNGLGNVLSDRDELPEAAQAYERALQLDPRFAEAHNNLGNALKRQGHLDRAIAAYQRSLEIRKDLPQVHNNLGSAYSAKRRLDLAIACFAQALRLKPDYPEAWTNLGSALRFQNQHAAAIAAYERALALNPNLAEVHNNLSVLLRGIGQVDRAIAECLRALELKCDLPEAHNNLGFAYASSGRLEEARACFEKTMRLRPDDPAAHSNLVYLSQFDPRFDAAQILAEARLWNQRHGSPGVADQGNRFCLLSPSPSTPGEGRGGGLPASEILGYSQQIAKPCPLPNPPSEYQERGKGSKPSKCDCPAPPQYQEREKSDRRLRIGYVSPDFRTHCQALFTLPLLSHHDHGNFEIFCYSDAITPDAMTHRLRSHADAWIDVSQMSHGELAARIRGDRIDILIDLTMHMARNRLPVFALKPAPLQASYLAYPGTTGVEAIDYRLSDPHLDPPVYPPGTHDDRYSEKTIRLPDTFWCYGPDSDASVGPELPLAASGFVTFGCLNNFWKVTESVVRLWAGVLAAVPCSRLMLLAPDGSPRERVSGWLSDAGVSPDRVDFVLPVPREDYLRRYHAIDICLDTFPYNGHTTSLDAFWMGVPVITLIGRTVVGRAGLSQLKNLGLSELAAATPAQFIRIAADLAADRPRLQELRRTLRPRMERSPLMNAAKFAKDIEAAYRQMWKERMDTDKHG